MSDKIIFSICIIFTIYVFIDIINNIWRFLNKKPKAIETYTRKTDILTIINFILAIMLVILIFKIWLYIYKYYVGR